VKVIAAAAGLLLLLVIGVVVGALVFGNRSANHAGASDRAEREPTTNSAGIQAQVVETFAKAQVGATARAHAEATTKTGDDLKKQPSDAGRTQKGMKDLFGEWKAVESQGLLRYEYVLELHGDCTYRLWASIINGAAVPGFGGPRQLYEAGNWKYEVDILILDNELHAVIGHPKGRKSGHIHWLDDNQFLEPTPLFQRTWKRVKAVSK
jgi:hypothetical protein